MDFRCIHCMPGNEVGGVITKSTNTVERGHRGKVDTGSADW